jgi:hypothetical protein
LQIPHSPGPTRGGTVRTKPGCTCFKPNESLIEPNASFYARPHSAGGRPCGPGHSGYSSGTSSRGSMPNARARSLRVFRRGLSMAPASTTVYEAAAHSRNRPLHLLGGLIRRYRPGIFFDFSFLQVSNVLKHPRPAGLRRPVCEHTRYRLPKRADVCRR